MADPTDPAAHTHGGSRRAGHRHLRPMAAAFVLVVAFMVVEIAAGLWTRSLALLADAGHMATDAIGLGMALAAVVAADRAEVRDHRTYGLYRLEILAALANAVLLLAVGGFVLVEAVDRARSPGTLLAGPMLLVAAAGLVVNLVAWRLLRRGAAESLNARGAYLEVMADLIGSVGAIAAGALQLAGWSRADAVIGGAIGVFILPRALRLAGAALRILLQAAPEHVDLAVVRAQLEAVPGVVDVHDLHVWTLTSEMDVATVHLVTRQGTDPHPVLDAARDLLRDAHGIAHATLQVEPDTHEGCAEISW